MARKHLTYVSCNAHKHEELALIIEHARLASGRMVKDSFAIEVAQISIPERLEIDLELMVHDEAIRAYERIRVPCFVEHAGLVFDDLSTALYPGGLTKPMWNALGDAFPQHT